MALKKTVSILCLLASTAMASTAPQITYVGAIPDTVRGTSGVGFKGNTLYWGWAIPDATTSKAAIDYIQNFNPANAANYTYNSVADTPLNNGVGQLASYNGTLYAMIVPTVAGVSQVHPIDDTHHALGGAAAPVFAPGGVPAANVSTLAFDSTGALYDINPAGNIEKRTDIRTAASTNTTLTTTNYTGVAVQPGTNTVFALTVAGAVEKGTINSLLPFSDPKAPGAQGLTFDSQGYLYVFSSDTSQAVGIQVYDAGGNLVTSTSTGMSQPLYGVFSPDGNYLIVSDSNNGILVFSISYNAMNQVVLQEVQKSHLSSVQVRLMTDAFMAGSRGSYWNSLGASTVKAAVDQMVHQSMEMMDKRDKMPNNVRITNSITREAARAARQNRVGNLGAFQSFTSSQKQYFTHLSQQLPFLQFQSVHSMVDPIALQNVNNGPVSMATPFEQPKMTLKPVFLSNEKSHIWIQPYGGLNRLKSYDQVTGLSFKTAGTAFGVGHYVSENIIMGVLTGGSISSYSQDFSNGTGDIDAGYLGIYGGYEKSEGGLTVDGSVTYGQSRYTSERNINALGLTAKGSHRGWDGSGRVRVGYKVYSGNSSVDPFVELGYRYSYEGSYQENNAGAFNLSVPSSTGKAVDIEIGARFEHTVLVNEVLVKPLIGISALRENPIDKKTNANLGFTDTGNLFSVPISNEIKTYATATIGCVAMFTNNVTLSALATGKARKHETGAELVLKASYAF